MAINSVIGHTSLLFAFFASVGFCSTLEGAPVDLAKTTHTLTSGDWSFNAAHYRLIDERLTVTSKRTNPKALLRSDIEGNATFRATLHSDGNFHWAGLIGHGAYQLVINNQNRRFELRVKEDGHWSVADFVDGYRVYVADVGSMDMRLVFSGNQVYGFLDNKLLVMVEKRPSAEEEAGVFGLVSGWKTRLTWGQVALADVADLRASKKDFAPRNVGKPPVSVTRVRASRKDGIYFDGERPELRFRVRADSNSKEPVQMKLVLLDIYRSVLDETIRRFEGERGIERDFVQSYGPQRRGAFKVALYVQSSSGEWIWIEDLGGFSVLPPVRDEQAASDSYFGGHIDGLRAEWHLQAARKVGFRWLRSHDGLQTTWWTRVQPNGPGDWAWPYDDIQRSLDRAGFKTLGEILWTPRWASSAPPGDKKPETAVPKDMEDFRRFVKRAVKHYEQSIAHWEIWNEPHYKGYWRGSPAEYVDLLRVAYAAIHSEQDDAVVLGGGGLRASDLGWIEAMLQAGAANHMDVFSIHYLDPNTAQEEIIKVRDLLRSYGFTGEIWNTEASVPSTSFLNQVRAENSEKGARYHFRNACYELVRMYMENISAGVKKVFYYHLFDPWRRSTFPKARRSSTRIDGGMWDEGRILKPIGVAHAAMVATLGDRRFYKRIDAGALRVFVFKGKRDSVAVQYAEFPSYAQTIEIRLPIPAKIRKGDFAEFDVMGNRSHPEVGGRELSMKLSREPRYLLLTGVDSADELVSMYMKAGKPTE